MNAETPYQSTLDVLLETTRLLWPEPAQSSVEGSVPSGRVVVREFLLLPSRQQPRLALPVHAAPVVAAVLRKYSQGLTLGERAARATLSTLVRLPGVNRGLTRMTGHRLSVSVPAGQPYDSLEDHLADILGSDVVVGVNLGAPRANRKPVLHALAPDGRTLAYVKVGTSDATAGLVRGEASALASFWAAGPPSGLLRVPEVLHHGRWRGLELLVLAPVRPTSARWHRRAVPTVAMRELGAHLGVSRSAFRETPVWQHARTAPGTLRDDKQASAFGRIVAAAESRYGDSQVAVGAWHGDWTPWNMVWDDRQVLLWDFERFAGGVPLGFDLAHYHLQTALREHGEDAAARMVRQGLVPGADTSGGADVLAGNDPDAVTVGYLVELGRRYLIASEPAVGQPLRARTRWLLDLLDTLVVQR